MAVRAAREEAARLVANQGSVDCEERDDRGRRPEQRADQGKGLRDGTFADLVKHMMLLPEDERSKYYIDKAGDRKFQAKEVTALAQLDDYPHKA